MIASVSPPRRLCPAPHELRWGALVTAAAVAVTFALLAAPGIAQAELTLDQTVSPTEVETGETAEFTVVVGNTGPSTYPSMDIGLLALRGWPGQRGGSVPNPYLSVTTSQGSCTAEPVNPSSNFPHGVSCQVGDVPAGGSVRVVSTVRINETMTQYAEAGDGAVSNREATVFANYPARVEGSRKIKVKGLPESCVNRDLKLTVSSKGAKKITAALGGPSTEWDTQLGGWSGGRKIAAEKGSELKLKVPLKREPAGHYELKLVAKPENGAKRTTDVTIQRCGVQKD